MKAVFVYNGNRFPLISVAHIISKYETSGRENPIWKIWVEYLKIWSQMLCLQLGVHYSFTVLLCKWNSRIRSLSYISKVWCKHESHISEQKNVSDVPLVNPEKVYLLSLHIKLGLI